MWLCASKHSNFQAWKSVAGKSGDFGVLRNWHSNKKFIGPKAAAAAAVHGTIAAFCSHSPSDRAETLVDSRGSVANQSTIIAPVESRSPVSCVCKKRFDGRRARRISMAHLTPRADPCIQEGCCAASSLLWPDRELINWKRRGVKKREAKGADRAIASHLINRLWLDPKIVIWFDLHLARFTLWTTIECENSNPRASTFGDPVF